MIKKNVFVVGLGLGGSRVGCDFQQKNYGSYLINGSLQDNKTLPDAKNMLVLEGYDGLAGDRSLAFEALKNNKDILQKVMGIDEKVILLVATGGGTTGSGSLAPRCPFPRFQSCHVRYHAISCPAASASLRVRNTPSREETREPYSSLSKSPLYPSSGQLS